jgi:hypothetical protein
MEGKQSRVKICSEREAAFLVDAKIVEDHTPL